MLLVNSSCVVSDCFRTPGEMPPCLICAYVMGALCVCSLVLWLTHGISLSPFFNDAHSAERSLLGGYGLLS